MGYSYVIDLREKVKTLRNRVASIQGQTEKAKEDTERVETLNHKISKRNYANGQKLQALNDQVEQFGEDNSLMKDIVEKLQQLVYGKRTSSEHRNSVIIEDSESLNRKLTNAKRACSCTKLSAQATSKSRTRIAASSTNFYSELPVHDYTDGRNHSNIMPSKTNRVNISVNPGAFGLGNKSQIESIKVYKLNRTDRNSNFYKLIFRHMKET